MVTVEKVVVMNCHVQQKVKVGKTVCDEASVVPWEVHSRDKVQRTENSFIHSFNIQYLDTGAIVSSYLIVERGDFCGDI